MLSVSLSNVFRFLRSVNIQKKTVEYMVSLNKVIASVTGTFNNVIKSITWYIENTALRADLYSGMEKNCGYKVTTYSCDYSVEKPTLCLDHDRQVATIRLSGSNPRTAYYVTSEGSQRRSVEYSFSKELLKKPKVKSFP